MLGCPARGEADELPLRMLAQFLRADGCVLEIAGAETLASELLDRVRAAAPAVVCISSLAPGGLAQAGYLCKRLRLHFASLKIIVGRWGQTDAIEKMKGRLLEAGATCVVTSLLEMRQQVVPLVTLQPVKPARHNQAPAPTSAWPATSGIPEPGQDYPPSTGPWSQRTCPP